MEKIEFSASAGTYTGYAIRYVNGSIFDENGEYRWGIEETGTYSWNEGAKTVTIKMEKTYYSDETSLDKAEYKKLLTAQYNYMIETMKLQGMTQAQIDAMIKDETGFSSFSQLIDAEVNLMFGNKPYTYSFSNDKKSLLMQRALPQPKGTDELVDKVYYGNPSSSDYDVGFGFHGNTILTLSSGYELSGKVFSSSGGRYWNGIVYGYYSYDSTHKQVYLKIVGVSGITAAEYYDTVTDDSYYGYINDASSAPLREEL